MFRSFLLENKTKFLTIFAQKKNCVCLDSLKFFFLLYLTDIKKEVDLDPGHQSEAPGHHHHQKGLLCMTVWL